MQTLTIEVETAKTGYDLHSILSEFHPDLVRGEDGRYFLTVEWHDDRRVTELMDTLRDFRATSAESPVRSTTIALGGRAP